MGRRRRGNPFTLFSFQDIITSVMGIMLLSALLLALELVTRTAAKAPPVDPNRLRSTVAARSATAAVDVDELKKNLAELQRNARVAAQTVVADSPNVDRRAEEELSRLEAELAELEKALRYVQKSETDRRARSFDRRDDRSRAGQLAAALDEIQSQIAELQAKGRYFYRPMPGVGKQSWLVEFAADRILVGRLESEIKPKGCAVDRRFADVKSFLNFFETLSSQSDFLMMLVRPDGVENFSESLDHVERRKFEYGFDLLGDDVTVFADGGRP